MNNLELDLNTPNETIEVNLTGGTRGLKGDTGPQGIQGEKGDTGEKGEKGDSGVWVGTTTPTDASNVWINPQGNPTTIPQKTSDLINDSDFVSDASYNHTDNNFTNSYKGKVDDNTTARHSIGNLSDLNTITKDNLVSAINELVERIEVLEGGE